MADITRIRADGVAFMPVFCHAAVAGDHIYVSGTLGTVGDKLELVEGGAGPQTAQALRNIERILAVCGASLSDLVKVCVYLTDMSTYAEMNEAYVSVLSGEVPARITVGCNGLALGAAVEIDAIAYKPR